MHLLGWSGQPPCKIKTTLSNKHEAALDVKNYGDVTAVGEERQPHDGIRGGLERSFPNPKRDANFVMREKSLSNQKDERMV